MNYGDTDTLKKETEQGFSDYDHNRDVDKDKLIEDQAQYIGGLERERDELKTDSRLLQDKLEASLRRIDFLRKHR